MIKHPLKKYENIILVLILFIVASLLLASNTKNGRLRGIMEKTALTLVTPVQKGITGAVRSVVGVWNRYIYLVKSEEENLELNRELMKQRFQSDLLLEELKKYRRVENLLSLHPIATSGFQIAGVVAWDSTNLARTLVIDRGTENNIKEGMIALTHEGLVGRVVTTAKRASRVLLITDARSAVDAYIQGSRIRSIVVGQNKNSCFIRYLPIDADIKEGDMLISSGLGSVYPKGLTLGRISSLKRGSDRLFYVAEMAPAADFKRMEELLVMLTTPVAGREALPVK